MSMFSNPSRRAFLLTSAAFVAGAGLLARYSGVSAVGDNRRQARQGHDPALHRSRQEHRHRRRRQGGEERGGVAGAAGLRAAAGPDVRRHPAGRHRAPVHRPELGQPFRPASTAASAATTRSTPTTPNSIPAPAGRASGSRSPRRTSPRAATAVGIGGPRSRARSATPISATSSTMDRSRPAFATAWTASRCASFLGPPPEVFHPTRG